MVASIDLNTIPLSATTVSFAGTIRWMSPEPLFRAEQSPNPRVRLLRAWNGYLRGELVALITMAPHPPTTRF